MLILDRFTKQKSLEAINADLETNNTIRTTALCKNNYIILRVLFSLISVFLLVDLSAQTRISSPYSYYGVGDLYSNNNARSLSMGRIGLTFRNSNYINFSNPSSYIGFDSTSFVFEGGILNRFKELETTESYQQSSYTNLSYLAFGFPVFRWWASSFGLLPFSSAGYKVSEDTILTNIGNVKYIYEGNGGINQLYFGNAFKIGKNLSIGINASYLFGTIDKIRVVSFPDSINYYNIHNNESQYISDLYFTYGLQYHKKLKNDITLETGLVFNNSSNISAKKSMLTQRFFLSTTSTSVMIDTLENVSGVKGNIKLPTSIEGGITFNKQGKWLVGVEGSWQNWSKYSSFGVSDSLVDSYNISVGTEFSPTSNNLSKYWKKMYYRFGLRYNSTYLQLNNNQINEYGISFGFGFPLRRWNATLNTGFELGRRGTTDNGLIRESFGNIIIGIAIKEKWFQIRKYE